MPLLTNIEQSFLQAPSLKALEQLLSQYLNSLDIYSFNFTLYAHHPKSSQGIQYDMVDNSMRLWHQHFIAEGYDLIDTTLDNIYQSTLPSVWDVREQLAQATTERERQMRRDSLAYGCEKGVSVPVHGPNNDFGSLTLRQMKGEDWLKAFAEIKFDLLAVAHIFYTRLKQLLVNELDAQPLTLSKREMQCLRLIAEHLSVVQIAQALAITERTVNYHIQNLNKKLGARNKHQSVVKATEMGLLATCQN